MNTPQPYIPRVWWLGLCLLLLGCSSTRAADDCDPRNLLIRFRAQVAESERTAFEQQEALEFVAEIKAVAVRLYRVPEGAEVRAVADRCNRNPLVEFAEVDHHRTLTAVPEPMYGQQWSLHNIGQTVNGQSGAADIDINWPEAMARFQGTTPVVVAVVDSGVALTHPEFSGRSFVNNAEAYGVAGRDDDGNGYVDDYIGWDFFKKDSLAVDENGHGTLVASIIAANGGNGVGGTGVCPTAKIMSLRVASQFGVGGTPKVARISDLAFALDYARVNGARVVNVSFGGGAYSPTEYSVLSALSSAGAVIVAAAGNGGADGVGDDNDITSFYPASYAIPNLIAVAAQDRTGGLAPFSNFGAASVHVAAPGTDIFGANLTRQTLFFDSFETGAPGWTFGAVAGNFSPRAWSLLYSGGNTYLGDRLYDATYYPYTNTYAASPWIDLRGKTGGRLSFNAIYSVANDWLVAEMSADGINWYLCPGGYWKGFNSGVSTLEVDISDLDGLFGMVRFRLLADGSNQGAGVWIDNVRVSAVDALDSSNPQYQHLSGTSFAAPIVSGVAALVISQRPDLSGAQVKWILLNAVRTVPALAGKVQTGGMIDAAKALQLADAAPLAPFFSSHPVNQNGPVGGAVSFSVAAGGVPAPALQWQRQPAGTSGFSNLPNSGAYSGVTTPALTVASLTRAMNGDQFRCVAVNGVGSGAVSAVATLSVDQTAQTISFPALAGKVFGDAPFTVSASASSGLPVTFAVVAGNATVAGGTVTLSGAGGVTLRASQAGDAVYAAAASVDQSFVVAKANSVLTWNPPAVVALGTLLGGDQLNATAVPTGGTFAYSPAAGTVLTVAGSQNLGVTYTPAGGDQGNFNNATASRTILVVDAQPTQTLVGFGYMVGGTVTVTQTLTYAGTCSGLGWQMVLPAGWGYAGGGGAEGDVKPSVGATNLLEWAWTSVPASPVVFTVTLSVPVGDSGSKNLSAQTVFRVAAGSAVIKAKPDPLVVSQVTTHSADTDRNFRVSLFELTRVIELYNTRNGTSRTGCYAVQAGTEDGFAPDAARLSTATVTLASYHAADSDHNGKVSLFELTRVIELYNTRAGTSRTGAYHALAGTEDGFAPGP